MSERMAGESLQYIDVNVQKSTRSITMTQRCRLCGETISKDSWARRTPTQERDASIIGLKHAVDAAKHLQKCNPGEPL